MHIVVWQARQSKDNCLSFPISFFPCFLTSFQQSFYTLNAQREWKWEAYEVEWILFSCCFFPPPFLLFADFISVVDRAWEAGSHGPADTTLHLGLIHTSSSTLLWLWWRWRARNALRKRDIEEQSGRERECEVALLRCPGKSRCIGSV